MLWNVTRENQIPFHQSTTAQFILLIH